MPDEQIVSEVPITMAEMKEEIDKVKSRDKDLNTRSTKTMEYISHFKVPKLKESKEMYAKIEKLGIPRLKDQHINKIIDLMPKTVDELKVILQGYTLTVNNENLKKIVDIVNEYSK